MDGKSEKSDILVINDFWPRWSENAISEVQFNLFEAKKTASKKGLTETVKVPPFSDKEVCILPIKYQKAVLCWKRPTEMLGNETKNIQVPNMTLYSDNSINLREINSHLKLSSYYYNIIDAFNALLFYKNWTAQDFNGFGFSKWEPINHIYSTNKFKPGAPHVAAFSDYGKYAIRLFHCGTWRLIIVDDRIPVNKKNEILIPFIKTENGLELWPLLITKALLKINFCRIEDEDFYYDQRHTKQCKMYDGDICNCKVFIPPKPMYLHEEKGLARINVIYALTGWSPFGKILSGYSASDVWPIFQSKLEQYKILEPTQTKKKGKQEKLDPTEKEKIYPLVVISILLPSTSLSEGNKINFIDLLCTECRNTPLFENIQPQEDLPLWKHFRWIYWAREKNIWKPFHPSIYWSLRCNLPVSLMSHFEPLLENEWREIVRELKEKGVENKEEKKPKGKKGAQSQSEELPVAEHWIQHNEIIPYLQDILEYPKIYSFERKFTFFDEEEEVLVSPKKPKKSKAGGDGGSKKSRKEVVEEVVEEKFDFKVDKTIELFLFCDQEGVDKMFADLSAVRTCPPEDISVVLEKFKWFCPKQKKIWNLKINNVPSLTMSLPKGRNIYRLRFMASKFYLRLLTNAQLRAGYLTDLLNMMDSETVQFTKYVGNLSKTFENVIGALGNKNFPQILRAFFQALLQYCDESYKTNVSIRNFIYDQFLEFILNFLKVKEDKEAKIAIQRLFLRPNFSESYDPSLQLCEECKELIKDYSKVKNSLCDCVEQGEPYYTEELIKKIEDCAAVTIQSVMKRFYVRRLKRFHSIINKQDLEQLKTSLKAFYVKYFINQPSLIFEVVRLFLLTTFENFQYNHNLENPIPASMQIGDCYEFYKDLKNSLYVLKYQGKENAAFGWTPLKIGCFYCHSDAPQIYIFNASISTKDLQNVKIFIKIIRCDNFLEITPYKEVPYLYKMSKEANGGYHVALYLYAPEPVPEISWMLQVGFPRHAPVGHFCNLCGMDKCHCPSDSKTYGLENFVINCKITNMDEFEVFRYEGLLFKNSRGFVCHKELYCEENSLIFGFFSLEGKQATNCSITFTKQDSHWPSVKYTFVDKIHFSKLLDPAHYSLAVSYEYPDQSEKNRLINLQIKGSSKIQKHNDETIKFNENEEFYQEDEMEETDSEVFGAWWLTIAYKVGVDVFIH